MIGLPLQRGEATTWPETWTSVRERLRMELGQGVFETWIAPLSLHKANDGHICLSAPRRLIRDYVTQHFGTRIERALAAATPGFSSLEIAVVTSEIPSASRTAPPLTALKG